MEILELKITIFFGSRVFQHHPDLHNYSMVTYNPLLNKGFMAFHAPYLPYQYEVLYKASYTIN
ncbi:hypothetical protein ACTXT7_007810 [Hymenolepis weldensis]